MMGIPDTLPLPRIIDDPDEARRLLTRRSGFEETELSPRMQAGVRRVFGADLTADEVVITQIGVRSWRGWRDVLDAGNGVFEERLGFSVSFLSLSAKHVAQVARRPPRLPVSVPELAAHAGITFDELVRWMVEDASLNR